MSQSKRWVFTLNNYTEEEWQQAINLESVTIWGIVGKEIGTEGTPHLQGAVCFAGNKRLNAVKLLLPRAHLDIMRGECSQNKTYCSKAGDFTEWGTIPKDRKAQAEDQKEKWDTVRALAIEGRFDEIPSDLYVRYMHTLKRMHMDDSVRNLTTQDWTEPPNEWHWGSTGTGKSRAVREAYPILYLKSLNKWWCGYRNEETVLIEEFCPGMPFGSFMKMWADRYAFRAETKGGSMMINPTRIIVTSNYSIDECFDTRDREAIKRRFRIISY